MHPRSDHPVWRFFPLAAADGYRNMAIDRALVGTSSNPVLRFYTWHPWTISLGYHQRLDTINVHACHKDGLNVVRRPTGGRAVLHAQELTYSVILPGRNHARTYRAAEIYERISQALVLGLNAMGVAAETASGTTAAHRSYHRTALCFASRVQHEITSNGKKLVGSAQRRFADGILQHGSLLLGPAHEKLADYLHAKGEGLNPKVIIREGSTSLQEILGREPDVSALADALKEAFAGVFACQLIDSRLTPEEELLVKAAERRLRVEIGTQFK